MVYLAAIALYLTFLIGVGVYKSRAVQTPDDFMVAGRRVSAWFLAGSLVCTWMGSGSLFGGSGRAFREGFSTLWMSAGAWAGILLVYSLAHRVRRIAQYTVPDILEMRYTPAARLLATLAIVIAYLTITSYQFIGGGRLLHILTGVQPIYGQAITGALVVTYAILAGMLSVVALDIFNGILITGGVLIAAPFVLAAAGGWEGVAATLPPSHFTLFGRPGVAPALGLFFPTFFLLLGESSMYQKFMSARDGQAARHAVIGMIIGVMVVEIVLGATAIFGAAIYWDDPIFVEADGTFQARATETIILQVARCDVPPLVGVLLLTGAVAIVFSTASTFLLVPSTSLVRDIYQRFINPQAKPGAVIALQRCSILALGVAAFLASSFFESILDMALYAYTMVGAAVTPALLGAFLWRRVTETAGTVSIAAGVLVTIGYAASNALGLTELDYDLIVYPAGGASILCLVWVSLITKPSPESKWRPFWST